MISSSISTTTIVIIVIIGCISFLFATAATIDSRSKQDDASMEMRPIWYKKRRIGLRLPNILHLKNSFASTVDGAGGNGYDKRRIGMRAPNIVYVREVDDGEGGGGCNNDVCDDASDS